MARRSVAAAAAFLIIVSLPSRGEPQPASALPDEPRQLVQMPPEALTLMQQDMRDHLAALDELLGLLAAGELDRAADLADSRLGPASMGRHRGSGMGPGRFMPPEMRRLGWSMHQAAGEFADIARTGEPAEAYTALQGITRFCVACHTGFRTR